ncbi:MAG: hypothetical protein ACRDSL_12030 [Pseudonocardiaceae bacterium]
MNTRTGWRALFRLLPVGIRPGAGRIRGAEVGTAVPTSGSWSPAAPGQLGVTGSQLAVLLRQAQWALDDAAHDFPAGRVSAQRREELAVTLEGLAVVVRASAPTEESR